MAASDGPKVGDVALVLNAIDGITAKDDADPVSVAVADIGFVWCAGTLAEVSGSDFVHAAPDGAHEPILGRSFVVVPSFPSRCPMAPAALRPGVRVLVQWDTEGDDKDCYVDCIVLDGSNPGAVQVAAGVEGEQWEWRAQEDSAIAPGAIAVRDAEGDEPPAPYEGLFIAPSAPRFTQPAHCCFAGVTPPMYSGEDIADLQVSVTTKNPNRSQAASAAKTFIKKAGVKVKNPLAGAGGGKAAGGTTAGMTVGGAVLEGGATAATFAAADGGKVIAATGSAVGTVSKKTKAVVRDLETDVDVSAPVPSVSEAIARAAAAASAAAKEGASTAAAAGTAVASTAAEGAGRAAEGAGRVAGAVGDKVRRLSSAALPAAVSEGAAAAAAMAAEETAAISTDLKVGLAAGADFWASGLAKGRSLVSFQDAAEMYTESRDKLVFALATAAGATVSLFSFVKLEVLRDFAQLLSLFIAGVASDAMRSAKLVFGNVSSIISLDISFVVPSLNPLYIYITIVVIAVLLILAYLWAMCMTSSLQMDEIRQGKEAKTWDVLATESKRTLTAIKYIFTAAFSLYLPVSRSAFQLLVCDATAGRALQALGAGGVDCKETDRGGALDSVSCDCSGWEYYTASQVVAGFLVAVFTLGLPIRTYLLIQRNKPVGSREDPNSRYDETGELVEYTDAMYEEDMQTDPRQLSSPYLFLYDSYERKWAFYKVLVMLVKLILALLVVLLFDRVLLQTALSLGVLVIMVVFAFIASPFLNAQADVMEVSGRVANLLTIVFGLIGSSAILPNTSTIMGILINVANGVNALVMLLMVLWGFAAVRSMVQFCWGALEFENVGRHRKGGFVGTFVGKGGELLLDLEKEVKLRVWHPFWQSLLLRGQDEAVAKRLVELQRITADVGRKRITEHFHYAYERAAARAFIMNELEGVDAFWDSDAGVADGKNSSRTHFAKAIVYTYPFHVVLAFDDDDDYAFIWEENILEFAAKNSSPEVRRRRHVREQLRAADMSGELFHVEHDEWVSRTVEDGTETYRDSEGNTKTRTVYSTIRVHLFFHRPRVIVAAEDSKEMARGFKFSLRYNDGHGEARKPRTGQMAYFSNESTTLSAEAVGFNNKFEVRGTKAAALLNDPKNSRIISTHLPRWRQKCIEYRAKFRKEEADKEAALSSAFWLHVYDASAMSPADLARYLATWETNPDMTGLMEKHKAGLQFLFQRMALLRSHPACALWYCFWSSVWENNANLGAVAACADILDPRSSKALAYRPMPRDKLEEELEGKPFRSTRRFVSNAVLDALYEQLNTLNDLHKSKPKQAWTGRRPSVVAGGAASAAAAGAVAVPNPLTAAAGGGGAGDSKV